MHRARTVLARCRRGAAVALAVSLLPALRAQGEGGHPASSALEIVQADASMEDKLGAMVDRDLEFTDEQDRPFRLKQWFPGDRPVILVLGYYGCPDMCGQVIHGMLEALNQVELTPGKDYQILNVSIDPRETAATASARKQTFLPQLHHVGGPEGWRFLVGREPAVKALADSVGFHYLWLEHSSRFDHPAALLFLTPEGRLNRVITGSTFEPGDVRLAILEAGKGENASFWDKVKLSCLTWDPRTNKYSLLATTIMRVGGAITLLLLVAMIAAMVRRERRQRRATTPASA